ncbi:MAG: hypothetical protein ACU836_14970 [Gammaproteobacteria bacterium]
MTKILEAISAVRSLACSADDFSGNCEEGMFLIEKCGSISDTLLRLSWAESNHRIAGQKIKDAITAVEALKEVSE